MRVKGLCSWGGAEGRKGKCIRPCAKEKEAGMGDPGTWATGERDAMRARRMGRAMKGMLVVSKLKYGNTT